MTAIGKLYDIQIPESASEDQLVYVKITVRNEGDQPGRIYGYIYNPSFNPGAIIVRYEGVDYRLEPGQPGLLIASPYDVEVGSFLYIICYLKFTKSGYYSIKFEAGHELPDQPGLFTKDDEAIRDVQVTGKLWIKVDAYPTEGYAPLMVKFVVSWGGGVPPVDFYIQYGDGEDDRMEGVETTDMVIFYHEYKRADEYEVIVQARDSADNPAEDRVKIVVSEPEQTYALTVNVSGAGRVKVYVNGVLEDVVEGSQSFDLKPGDSVSLYAEPDEGYEFTKYVVDGQEVPNDPLHLTMDGDVTVTAYFQEESAEEKSAVAFVDMAGNPISGGKFVVFDRQGNALLQGYADNLGEISVAGVTGEVFVECFKESASQAYDAIALVNLPGSYVVKDDWFTERTIEVVIKIEAAGDDWFSSILNGMIQAGMIGAWIMWILPFTPLYQINQIVNGILLNYLKQNQPEGIEFLYASLDPANQAIRVGFRQKVSSPVSWVWAVIAAIIAVAVLIGAVGYLIQSIKSTAVAEAKSEAIKKASDIYEQASQLLDTVNEKLEKGEITPEQATEIINALTSLMESMKEHVESLGGEVPEETCKILFGTIDIGKLPEPWCGIANGLTTIGVIGLGLYAAYKLIPVVIESFRSKK